MTPQELKRSILLRAIQGKLVEQKDCEGTPDALLNEIKRDKESLIKNKLLKKEKALESVSEDEIPFEIPNNWRWVRLGECGAFVRGSGIKKDETTTSGKPCVRYGQLYTTYNTRFSKAVSFTSNEVFDKCQKVHKNDILMALTGENNFDIALAVAYEGEEEIAMGGDMTKFSHHHMNPLYLVYAINSAYGISCKSRLATGNIIVHISNDKLASIPIPLPPLAEQHRIVAKIEELLPYIDRYEKAWTKLEEFNKKFPGDMQKSILQTAIQGKLVEQRPEEGTGEELYQQIQKEKLDLIKAKKIKKEKPLPEIRDDEVPFEIPESWKWVRLGVVMRFQGGYAYKSTAYVPTSNNQIIRLGNVKQDCLLPDVKPVFISDILAKETETYKIQVNDILVTMTGTRRKKDYFYVHLINEKDLKGNNFFLNQRVGCFKLYEGVYPPYILRVLQNETIRDLIFTKETGTANQGNLGSEDMKKFVYIPLPPLAEQKRIVDKLERILPICSKLKQRNEV